nr:hypothetical protein BaRGS_006083 [Batillaria attramentaria]
MRVIHVSVRVGFSSRRFELIHEIGWFTFLDYPAVLAGSCIGIGNVIDFPGFVSKHGGGAFLMAYFTVLCVSGVPLFYLETCLGRFTSMGPARCWEFAPLFTGAQLSEQ